jgi:alpha-glucosidase
MITSLRSKRWADGAIVYQIYPRSFYDSNADGIGDIPGITKKLGYLKRLGINAIWLSPFYPSPMADFGYDVANYTDVDPIFGTLHDMKQLIRAAHRRGIRVMVDLVPNHSSDEHEWFRQSRQSKEGTYADWYIWRDPSGFDDEGQPIPPNNWLDIFTGGSAWQWEPARGQFYLHSFDVHQPDLNWANPEVRAAIKDAMRFWLDNGVDGFRVDAVRFMGKDPTFQDNPTNPEWKEGWSRYSSLLHKHSQGWPQLYSYLNEMSEVLKDAKYRKRAPFMVTESYPDTHEKIEEYLTFYQSMDPEVAAPFNFEGLGLPWQAKAWKDFLGPFHAALDDYNPLCISSYAFGNHDQWRLATRLGEPAARAAAVMLLTLPGMAFIYNGEEIGMVNGKIPPHLVQDPGAVDGGGRDPERTPMQWNAKQNAGFTKAETSWLPVAEGYKTRNVAVESHDKDSFLSLYRKLGRLRNSSNALKHGTLSMVASGNEFVLSYLRINDKKRLLILVNFSDKPQTATIPGSLKIGRCLISSHIGDAAPKIKDHLLKLRAHEAVVFTIKN